MRKEINCNKMTDKMVGAESLYIFKKPVMWVLVIMPWHLLQLQTQKMPHDMKGTCQYVE
jgi:hypothetical protein